MIYLGLAQWSHPHWARLGITTLADYAQYFNCVEGNTTFYALPHRQNVLRWREMTDDNFRFCFKFPATISHQSALENCQSLCSEFFETLSSLESRVGQYWLQLPARFSPEHLPALWQFLDSLPSDFNYGVEVRHLAFFAKGEAERTLNQGLQSRGVNRVILDSRPVHLSDANNQAMIEAQRKKPKVPVHAIATATEPFIRFIGGDDMALNAHLFENWTQKLTLWSEEKTPYLFIHTADMGQVFSLIDILLPTLRTTIPSVKFFSPTQHQPSLF